MEDDVSPRDRFDLEGGSDCKANLDLDGDGKVSPWEANLCRMCLISAIIIAFGNKLIN